MATLIGLEELRDLMRKQSEEDRKNRTITVEGPSVEEALKRASIELGVPVRRLEFEVAIRGSDGMLGMGRKPWKLSVYEKSQMVKTEQESQADALREEELSAAEAQRPKDRPGEVFVRIQADGVYLKVTRPQGRGPKATELMALERLSLRGVSRFDEGLVSRVVKHADGEYVHVADVQYNPNNDSTVSMDITDGSMKAVVVLSEPGPGGADISAEYLRSVLQSN
ncbi:MAG TPA: Jag N-terminal domain-containing protein, partial [Spirochaetia bacterium]|nr:Jag N-terminal domain-containing protein [Spirochaetia bacterium]